jgi:hypothetical protein
MGPSIWLGALMAIVALPGCSGGGAGGGLVVIPPAVEKASVADGKYENVHAVYLYDVGYVHFDPIDIGNTYFPSYVTSRFVKVKLLTREATEGYRWGNIFIRHYSDLLKLDAHIIKKDGRRVDLTKNDFLLNALIKDVVPDANPPIDFNETTVIFPGVEAGDTIVYSYTSRGRELTWSFNRFDAPVVYSKFMVAQPMARSEIQPLIYNRHKLELEKGTDKGLATGMAGYTGISRQATYDVWTTRDVPAIIAEQAVPPLVEVASRLRVWQGARKWDWNTLGTTYYKWFTHYGRPPSAAKELATKAIAGAEDARARAKAIHDWVKKSLTIQASFNDLNYVPREIEVTTIDLAKVMKEKIVSPEQAANVMWLLMNAAGVDAAVVVSSPYWLPVAEEGLHDFYQFTTPFLMLDDGTLIDTTDRFAPFGQLPWYYEGRKAMKLKGSTVSFLDLPVSEAKANQKKLALTGQLDDQGQASAEARFEMSGQMALAFRKHFGPMNPKEREEGVRAFILAAADKAEVDEFALVDLDDPDKPLGMNIKFHVPGYADLMRDKMIAKLGAFVHHTVCPVMTNPGGDQEHICPKTTAAQRTNPVQFPFRRYEEMDIRVQLPAGFALQALPKGFRTRDLDQETAVGVQTSYGLPEAKLLHVIRKFSVNRRWIDQQAYPALVPLIQRFQEQKDTLVTLELPKMD